MPHPAARLGAPLAAFTGLGAATVAYAAVVERRWLRVSHHELRVRHLPPVWDGLRVVHLTDFHLGSPGAPYGLLRRAVARAVALRPDLVALTGDYTERGDRQPLDFLAPLIAAAPTFAVLGNHDYFGSPTVADATAAELRSLGACVLRDTVAPFTFRGVTAPVAGFDDRQWGRQAGVAATVAIAPSGVPLALTHPPDRVDDLPPGWAGLALSGHTHAAQVRLSPVRTHDWVSLRVTEMYSRYLRGLFDVGGTQVYVNAGLGTARLPLRFFARPELATFTLHAADAHS